MADSLKRTTWAKDAQVQDRVRWYLWEKASGVIAAEIANPASQAAAEVSYAKKVFSGSASFERAAFVVALNAAIGAAVDGDQAVADAAIQTAVTALWSTLATADIATGG